MPSTKTVLVAWGLGLFAIVAARGQASPQNLDFEAGTVDQGPPGWFVPTAGYQVAWTGMRVLKHDGSHHHGIGILPTVPVQLTIAGIRAGRDELLEKAIEVVTR